ncbi:hypothetical protein BDR22DRAFT_657085 [Usnea florida]
MVLLRWLPLLALSSLPVSMCAAINTPPSLNLFAPSDMTNVTQLPLETPSDHPANLTYAPWPPRPLWIELHPRFSSAYLVIFTVEPFRGSWPIRVPALQNFLGEFRDNLESEYPIPGFLPSVARQSTVDVESYSSWTIELEDTLFGLRLPTEYAVLALDELARLMGTHGPATLSLGVQEGRSPLGIGTLAIKPFGSGELSNQSLSNSRSVFQTSQTKIL